MTTRWCWSVSAATPDANGCATTLPTVLGNRYDAFLWIGQTHALHPLHTRQIDMLEPETYPSGV